MVAIAGGGTGAKKRHQRWTPEFLCPATPRTLAEKARLRMAQSPGRLEHRRRLQLSVEKDAATGQPGPWQPGHAGGKQLLYRRVTQVHSTQLLVRTGDLLQIS